MATQVATDHVGIAKQFLARSKGYLADGDLHQASEKGWGAAAHIAKAVAHENGWDYEHHDQFDNIIANAAYRYHRQSLMQYGDSAHGLHRYYYQHPSFLNANRIQDRIADVEKLVITLEPLL